MIFIKSGAIQHYSGKWKIMKLSGGQNATVTVGFKDHIMFTDSCHSIKAEKHYLHSDRHTT